MISVNNYPRFRGLLVLSVLIGFVYGCSGESADQKSKYPKSSVVNDFIQEDELVKMLTFAREDAGAVVAVYLSYSKSYAISSAKKGLLSTLRRDLQSSPGFYEAAERVIVKWDKENRRHSYSDHYREGDDIRVSVVLEYLTNQYPGGNLGKEYGITNQQLAYFIIESNGEASLLHLFVTEHQI